MSKQLPPHVVFNFDDSKHVSAIGTCDFPMAEVIDHLDGPQRPPDDAAQESAMALAADGLSELLWWVWQPEKQRQNLQAPFRRFIAASMTLNPQLLNSLGLKEVAAMAGVTKALLSKQSLRFSRRFGLHFRRQHNGIENMQRAMVASHQRRKRNANPTPAA